MSEGLIYNDIKFGVSVCEGDALKHFYDKHGHHYKSCVSQKLESNINHKKDLINSIYLEENFKKEKEKKKRASNHQVTLGDQKYFIIIIII